MTFTSRLGAKSRAVRALAVGIVLGTTVAVGAVAQIDLKGPVTIEVPSGSNSIIVVLRNATPLTIHGITYTVLNRNSGEIYLRKIAIHSFTSDGIGRALTRDSPGLRIGASRSVSRLSYSYEIRTGETFAVLLWLEGIPEDGPGITLTLCPLAHYDGGWWQVIFGVE